MLNVLIDPGEEELLPLTEIPSMDSAIIPRARSGRKIAASTIYRWATRGCRGIKLEVLRTGGVTCTTRAALLRFYEGVTRRGAGIEVPPPRVPARRIHERVERQLDQILNDKR